MRVTITGATGTIGQALTRELRERGDEVTALSRDAGRASAALGVEAQEWKDPKGERPPLDSLRGRDGVVHLLGETIAQRWSDDVKREIRDSRILTTRNLVEGAARAARGRAAEGARLPVGHRLVRRPRRRAARRVGSRRRRLPRPGDGGLGDRGREGPGAGAARGHSHAPASSCRSRAARSRRCSPSSSSGIGGPVAGGRQYVPWVHLDDVVGVIVFALDTTPSTAPST